MNKLGVGSGCVAPTRGGPYAADEAAGGCWGLLSKRGEQGFVRSEVWSLDSDSRKGGGGGRGGGRELGKAPREQGSRLVE